MNGRPPVLEDFPDRTFDKLRYGDTDRQGHINNAVFATLYETGRVGILDAAGRGPDLSFVIARITIDYRAEMFWPGNVDIGTGIRSLGRSSVTMWQALFQNGKCVSTAESVVVQVDRATRRGTALDEATRARLQALIIKG